MPVYIPLSMTVKTKSANCARQESIEKNGQQYTKINLNLQPVKSVFYIDN